MKWQKSGSWEMGGTYPGQLATLVFYFMCCLCQRDIEPDEMCLHDEDDDRRICKECARKVHEAYELY